MQSEQIEKTQPEPIITELFCIVDKNPVPARRATGRNKDTCSPECAKKLRRFKKEAIRRSKCPTCWHPSTPEQREEFKQWRRHRGDLREQRGRPKRRDGLVRALELFIEGFESNDTIAMAGACDLARQELDKFTSEKKAKPTEVINEDRQTEDSSQ